MGASVPAGYMQDAQGRLVPVEMVKEIDLVRDRLVIELIGHAKAAAEQVARFKGRAMGDIEAFVELSGEKYGITMGGKKGNVTLMSYDGRYKIQRAVTEHLVFDERLQVAKTLIDQCIHEWAAGASAEIRALVDHAFKTDAEGKVSPGRILGLRRLDITHPKWQQAMQSISDAMQIAGSKSYLRLYERIGDGDQYQHIPLDIAAI